MTQRFTFVFAGLLSAILFATPSAYAVEATGFTPLEASDLSLDEYQWTARPIVIFADTAADPRFAQQLEQLAVEWPLLAERDVVVITDTDPAAKSAIRTKLRPRGFMFTLIAKDGTVALRKPAPWTVREITRSIDKMPDREQEIRDRRLERFAQ